MTPSGDGSAQLLGKGPQPTAGVAEQVGGTGTGLLREVARMPDGRRITYYSLPADRLPDGSSLPADSQPDAAGRGGDGE